MRRESRSAGTQDARSPMQSTPAMGLTKQGDIADCIPPPERISRFSSSQSKKEGDLR